MFPKALLPELEGVYSSVVDGRFPQNNGYHSCVASEPRSHSLNSSIYIEGIVQMLELCSCPDI